MSAQQELIEPTTQPVSSESGHSEPHLSEPRHSEVCACCSGEKAAIKKPPRKSSFFRHWRRLSWSARLMAIPVYFYRIFLSPLLPRMCRFEPSCSVYALEALSRHGPIKGTWIALRRLARCHPFKTLGGGGSGYDPVPGTEEAERWAALNAKEASDGR